MAASKRTLGEEENIQVKKPRDDSVASVNSQPNGGDYDPSSYQVCEHRGNWMSLYDSTSGYFYYQNTKTLQTQWEKPSNWDNLPPVFNPWVKMKPSVSNQNAKPPEQANESEFKSMTGKEFEEMLNNLMKRPARRQADPAEKSKEHWIPEGATEYNIWYDKWVGENWHPDGGPAETRCCLDDDAGYTKANIIDPKTSRHHFCLFFAKGSCHLGRECGFLHSIPIDKDEKRIGLSIDSFGRERHLNHKENLGGVGSFEKDCTTLYVGGLGNRKAVERELWEEFGEWGEIEDIRVISSRNIGFVRYKNRLNAEFAKIAMSDQKLGGRDVLNVRWANDDPNPRAYKKDLENAKEKLVEAAYEKGIIQELESRPQPIASGDGLTAPYPNTDNQYANHEYWSWYYKNMGYDNQQDYKQQQQQQQQQEQQQQLYTQQQQQDLYTQQQEQQYEQSKAVEEANENYSRLDRIFKQMESNNGSTQATPSVDMNGASTTESEIQNEHKHSGTDTNTITSSSDTSKDPYRN